MAGVLVALGLGWAGTPASADEGVRLSGTAGWAGRCHSGRPILVRARIGADRLVSGVLSAQAAGGQSVTTEVAVEVAGGSEKEVVLVTSSPSGCGGLVLRLQEGRSATTTEVGTNEAGDTVLFGLLPGARRGAAPPASVLARPGVAAVTAVEPEVLDLAGAVAGLDSIGATTADLDDLSASQRRALLTWVADGGTLLVDADGPDGVGALPEAWRPAKDGRTEAGRGQVRLTGTALRDGRVEGLGEPGAATASADFDGFDGDFVQGEGMGTLLQRRSGLRVLSLPIILSALVLYVIVVGPGVRVGLRRLGRLQLTWLVIPLAALAFTGLAVAGGDLLRRGGKPVHLSVIETEAAGSRSRSYVGVPTRSRGDVEANLPAGWLAGNQALGSSSGPSTVRITPRGQRLRTAGQAGGFVVLGADGPSPVEGRLSVAFDPAASRGKVTNNLRIPLEDVAVFVPGNAIFVGSLAPGASNDFVAPAGFGPLDLGSLGFQAWGAVGERLADPEVFATLLDPPNRLGPNADVVAAGWTDRLDSPVALRSGGSSGTTLVLGRPDDGPLTGEAVGSSNTGWHTTRFIAPERAYLLSLIEDRFGVGKGVRVVPGGGGGIARRALAEVLVDGRWVTTADGGALPKAAAADGVVYVRINLNSPVLPALAPA